MGLENAVIFTGKAEDVLPEQYEKNKVYADVIVVDPPRKGCDQVCLDTILKNGTEKGCICQLRFFHTGKRFKISGRWRISGGKGKML